MHKNDVNDNFDIIFKQIVLKIKRPIQFPTIAARHFLGVRSVSSLQKTFQLTSGIFEEVIFESEIK